MLAHVGVEKHAVDSSVLFAVDSKFASIICFHNVHVVQRTLQIWLPQVILLWNGLAHVAVTLIHIDKHSQGSLSQLHAALSVTGKNPPPPHPRLSGISYGYVVCQNIFFSTRIFQIHHSFLIYHCNPCFHFSVLNLTHFWLCTLALFLFAFGNFALCKRNVKSTPDLVCVLPQSLTCKFY